jgi:hypothetical protein
MKKFAVLALFLAAASLAIAVERVVVVEEAYSEG